MMIVEHLFLYIILGCMCVVVGLQLKWRELRLATRKYNYRPAKAQLPTVLSAIVFCLLLLYDIIFVHSTLGDWAIGILVPPIVFFIVEWTLARVNPYNKIFTWIVRCMLIVVCCFFLSLCAYDSRVSLLGFFIVGIYLRNSPFGAPHIKDLCLEAYMSRKVSVDWREEKVEDSTAVEYTGKKREFSTLERYDARDLGVVPNSKKDQRDVIQKAIDTIGEKGGGTLYFPHGRYRIDSRTDSFLQINYSNISLEGETDKDGHPVAVLVDCRPTVRGHKNPWLSPFLITTGEKLQPSNEVWGVDFRKKKNTFSVSNSLSDPGSDGQMLTPRLATTITSTAKKGDTFLEVADSSRVGRYVLIAMYNTTRDGNLLKDLLGMDSFRAEWTLCHRAGEEEAPSYQWLVEVKERVNEKTIRLVRPLLRDIDVTYMPEVYNVEMLENVVIRNLCFDSEWNGMFCHHGCPLYYSIRQAQEMDYGWNAINMKRVVHSEVRNVVIKNFINPLYVMDSRNVTVSNLRICGYDGHQGIKLYMHSCDNLFEHITFSSHFADMMGGEGNSYANVFEDVRYLNPEFHPVDYDFHGFAAGPMSPPADNTFMHVYGFRYVKHAGAIDYLPSAAQNNTWISTVSEGEKRGDYLFYNAIYRPKKGAIRFVTAVGYALAMVQKRRNLSPKTFVENVKNKLRSIDYISTERSQHKQFIPMSRVVDIKTWGRSQF